MCAGLLILIHCRPVYLLQNCKQIAFVSKPSKFKLCLYELIRFHQFSFWCWFFIFFFFRWLACSFEILVSLWDSLLVHQIFQTYTCMICGFNLKMPTENGHLRDSKFICSSSSSITAYVVVILVWYFGASFRIFDIRVNMLYEFLFSLLV